MKNEFNPPLTDRGVENTSGLILKEKNVLIDWFEYTIRDQISPFDIFTKYLHINKNDVLYEKVGIYGYNKTFYYRDIKVLVNEDRKDLGVHVIMSGKGCRDFENLNLDWIDYFKFLLCNYDIKITRIDVAIDTFTDKYYTLQKLREYISNGQVVSKFKSSTEFIQKSLSTSDIESETIWFGSRTSNIQIVFYNKLYERNNANYEVDPNIKYWYRCESRFRNDMANTLVECFTLNDNYMNVINDVLYNYLDFKDYSYTESNKSRWNTSIWWLDFLDTNKKLSLKINIKESDITTKKQWISKSVSKSELLVYLSELSINNNISLDNYSLNYLIDILKEGSKRLSVKDMSLVNESRIKNGLQPFEDKDFIDVINNLLNF